MEQQQFSQAEKMMKTSDGIRKRTLRSELHVGGNFLHAELKQLERKLPHLKSLETPSRL